MRLLSGSTTKKEPLWRLGVEHTAKVLAGSLQWCVWSWISYPVDEAVRSEVAHDGRCWGGGLTVDVWFGGDFEVVCAR